MTMQSIGSRLAWASVAALALAGAAQGHEPQASPGKPHAPVDAELLVARPLEAGVPARVRIAVTPAVAVDRLAVELRGTPGLEVMAISPNGWNATAAGETRYAEIDLTPVSGGRQRLTAFLTVSRDGGSRGRAVVLSVDVKGPVTIASGKPKKGAVEFDAAGEPIRSIPAETTISR